MCNVKQTEAKVIIARWTMKTEHITRHDLT